MIVEKVYKIRYNSSKDIDEVIELLADDIKNGYTTKTVSYLGDKFDIATVCTEPNYEIIMAKKWMVNR